MPYDPRPVSEGGNRGIDEQFSRKAPAGKFRVICVDTFDGTDWVSGDFDTIDDAFRHAAQQGGEMLRAYIYDEDGSYAGHQGRF